MKTRKLKILKHPTSPKAALEADFIDVVVREGVFPSGAFSIAIPLNWKILRESRAATPGPERPFITLAKFTPGGPDAQGFSAHAAIAVHVAFLFREVNGSDWLRQWLTNQDLVLEDFRDIPTGSDIMGDALALNKKSGRLHRVRTLRDGDLLFIVDGSISAGQDVTRPELQEIALIASARFQVLKPSVQTYAEIMTEITLASATAHAGFIIPQSWNLVEPKDVPPGGAVRQLHHTKGGIIAGTIVAALGRDGSYSSDLGKILRMKLESQGFSIEGSQKYFSGCKGSMTLELKIWPARRNGSELVILDLAADRCDQPFSLSLISPTAEVNFEAWSINRRAFGLAMQTLSIKKFF
jgi:hypothetical protein